MHAGEYGATEFNPTNGPGRFRPFSTQKGTVPTMYGAGDVDGALSETVLHDVPIKGPGRRVDIRRFDPYVVSRVKPKRDLNLVKLRGLGLGALGVSREELIDSDATQYPRTAEWAVALHVAHKSSDGLLWTPRQNDAALALMLFGDRVKRSDLEITKAPLPLTIGPGRTLVRAAAKEAKITIARN